MAIAPAENADRKPETYVKFRGMKAAAEGIPTPSLGDIQTFEVTAECVSVGTEKRADGEQRPVIGMRVMEVEPGEITAAPTDGQLALVADEDGDDD